MKGHGLLAYWRSGEIETVSHVTQGPALTERMAIMRAPGSHKNAELLRRLLASSRLVMSAWPWKAARDNSPTLSSRSMSACVSRASAPVKSSPSSSKRKPASDFLHVEHLSAHAHVQD